MSSELTYGHGEPLSSSTHMKYKDKYPNYRKETSEEKYKRLRAEKRRTRAIKNGRRSV